MNWNTTVVERKGVPVQVFRPCLERAPTPAEYDEIKAKRKAMPTTHLRLGDVASDGRVFLRVHPTGFNGEQWTDVANIDKVRVASKSYWDANKVSLKLKQKEHFARNRARMIAKMREWQIANEDRMASYRRAYYQKTRESQLAKKKKNPEYYRELAKRARKGKQDRQAAYSSGNRARKISSDLGLSKQKAWRVIYLLYFEMAANRTETTLVHHSVDHLYPLTPREGEPSGLHVPWNLRIAPTERNLEKHNRPPTSDEIAEADQQWREIFEIFERRHPRLFLKLRSNKTDAGNGSNGICRVSNVFHSPSPDP